MNVRDTGCVPTAFIEQVVCDVRSGAVTFHVDGLFLNLPERVVDDGVVFDVDDVESVAGEYIRGVVAVEIIADDAGQFGLQYDTVIFFRCDDLVALHEIERLRDVQCGSGLRKVVAPDFVVDDVRIGCVDAHAYS